MEIYHILNLFLYFEILVLVFVFLMILVHRITDFFNKKSRKKISEDIASFLSSSLESPPSFFLQFPYQLLLQELEVFDRRLLGEDWSRVKNEVVKKYLLPRACLWANSLFWRRRNFSARVFLLMPLADNEDLILKLIKDSSFLVRSIASKAVIKLKSTKGVLEILVNMKNEPGFGRYYFGDILSQATSEILQLAVDFATQDESYQLVCLEVLAHQVQTIKIPFLSNALHSDDFFIRKAAIEVAIANPQAGSIDLFSYQLKNDNEKIRILACKGLGNYLENESLELLQKSLQDCSSLVKLEAAKSLKKLNRLDLIEDASIQSYVKEFA